MSSHGVAGLWGDDGDTVADWVWRARPCGVWGASSASHKVEDVQGNSTSRLLGSWHVRVVRLEVPIEDVVVPVSLAAGGASLRELDVQSPSARAGLGWGHVISSCVVVP